MASKLSEDDFAEDWDGCCWAERHDYILGEHFIMSPLPAGEDLTFQ